MNQVVLAPSGDSPAADGAGEEGVQEVQGEGEAGDEAGREGDEAGREEAARGRRLQAQLRGGSASQVPRGGVSEAQEPPKACQTSSTSSTGL